jgi:hypothetical protein
MTRQDLYGWCRVPVEELANHPLRRVPLRECRDSQEMGESMARELGGEIPVHKAKNRAMRAIIPCGPSRWYDPFTTLVNRERDSTWHAFRTVQYVAVGDLARGESAVDLLAGDSAHDELVSQQRPSSREIHAGFYRGLDFTP